MKSSLPEPKLKPIRFHDTVKVAIFPNPTSNYIFVTLTPRFVHTNYILLDEEGTELENKVIDDSFFKIDMSDLKAGDYQLRFYDGQTINVNKNF